MSIASVNIDKSIQRKRLIYKMTVWVFLDYFFTYLGGSILVICCLAPNFTGKNPTPLIIVIASCSGAIWMIANLVSLSALVKLEGKDIDTNRKDINSVLNAYYSGYTLVSTDRLIRSVKLSTSLRWGKIITVILEEETMYLNITTLGRGDGPSPFHGLYNYTRCRSIAKIIKSHQNQTK
jgi:hypothetical protein